MAAEKIRWTRMVDGRCVSLDGEFQVLRFRDHDVESGPNGRPYIFHVIHVSTRRASVEGTLAAARRWAEGL